MVGKLVATLELQLVVGRNIGLQLPSSFFLKVATEFSESSQRAGDSSGEAVLVRGQGSGLRFSVDRDWTTLGGWPRSPHPEGCWKTRVHGVMPVWEDRSLKNWTGRSSLSVNKLEVLKPLLVLESLEPA